MIGKRAYLPAIEGRTFVCGDLHGSYSRLIAFMDFVEFDKTKDRMISVGDLVDRGPENMQCLRLLNASWFHAVKGNHEQMMFDSFNIPGWIGIWRRNGGTWPDREVGETDLEDELDILSEKANDLPVMLTVDKSDGTKFHVIHAELFMPDGMTDTKLDDPEIFDEITNYQSMDGEYVIWGRGLFGTAYGRNMENKEALLEYQRYLDLHGAKNIYTIELSHIYCGHSVMQKPLRVYGQTNLDTGAYKSYDMELGNEGLVVQAAKWAGLTITEPETDKFWTINSNGVHETKPLIIAERN